jgi:voltage-gated potassium channel
MRPEIWLKKARFRMLLIAALLVLIIPAFHRYIPFPDLLFVVSMSFLFVQSIVVARFERSLSRFLRFAIAAILLAILWMKPAGINSDMLEIFKLLIQALFFGFVIYFLLKFVTKAKTITSNVILVVVIIYLLMGIIAGNISYLLYLTLPHSFAFPEWIDSPGYVDFLYFGFVAMSTTGFGDIAPAGNEAKTFAYLIAITGQLYVAIVIAVIVGKYLAGKNEPNRE